MTIAPFSNLGNIQGANAQTGGGLLGTGGLAGLFAALLGGQTSALSSLQSGSSDQPALDEGMADILKFMQEGVSQSKQGLGRTLQAFLPQQLNSADMKGVSSESLLSDLFGSSDVAGGGLDGLLSQFGEGEVTAVFYQKIVVEIQKVSVSLHTSGVDLSGIQSLDQLAAAFEKMGMPQDMAQAKAKRVDEAIRLMQKRLGIEVESETAVEENALSSVLFSMFHGSGLAQSELLASSASIQVSHTMLAFESSNSLVSSDVAMKVLKGESLSPALKGALGENALPAEGKASVTPQPLVHTKVADVPVQSVEGEFAPMTAKDFATADITALKATPDAVAQAPVKQSAEIATLADDAGQFVAANEDVAKQRKSTSSISEDKLLGDVKARDLFTVKPAKDMGMEMNMQLETFDGEVMDVEMTEDGGQEVAELVAQKTAFDNRVEGLSRPAMAKISTISSQVDIQMRQLINQNGGQVKFRLDPPELGEVNVELKIQGGSVKGTIIVQSIEAAEQLARDLRLLQESLQEAGLNLSEEGLKFQLQDEQPDSDHQHASGESEEGSDTGSDTDADINAQGDVAAEWVRPDALVDVSI